MRVARLVGRDEERAAHPQALVDEARVHRREREQRRDRRPLPSAPRVAQAEERVTRGDRRLGEHREPVERGPSPSSAVNVASRTRRRERLDPVGIQRGSRAADQPRGAGRSDERPATRGPSNVDTRHHEPLPQVVDRRVRHLGEALAQIRRRGPSRAGERRDRRVVAHRRDGVVRRSGRAGAASRSAPRACSRAAT